MESGGDFSQFEIKVKKSFSKTQEDEVAGQYVTKIFLEKEGWDDEMIENSRKWALARGLHRTSEVHGREEWKIPLKETYSFKTGSREEASAEATSIGEDSQSVRVIG